MSKNGKARRSLSFESSVKNLFRQHFNQSLRFAVGAHRKRNVTYTNEFQKARLLARVENLPALYSIVESKSHYPFNGLGAGFSTDNRHFVDSRLRELAPLSLGQEVSLQTARLNHHKSRLVGALDSVARVNNQLSNEDWSLARDSLEQHRKDFGTSLVMLKKDLLCTLGASSLSALTRRLKELTTGYEHTAYALMVRIIYDFTDPTYDPSRASRHWTGAYSEQTGNDWYTRVIEGLLFPFPVSKERFSALMLRLNATSLLDMCFTFWKAHNLRSDWPELRQGWSSLDSEIRNTLENKFTVFQTPLSRVYDKSASKGGDKEVYRQAFLFDEYTNIARWLGEIQALAHREHLERASFDYSWLEGRSVMLPVQRLINGFQPALADFERTAASNITFLKEDAFTESHDHVFSLTVAEVLRNDVNHLSERQLVTLFSRPTDLHENISQNTISKLKDCNPVKNSALLRFIVSEIQFRKNRTGDNELERRLNFMEMFPSNDRSEVVPYLDHLLRYHGQVAVQLAGICNRRFLEKLFLMMSSVKEVIEVRIDLCDWLIEHDAKHREDYVEERSALSRELGNLDAQSDLDSTRIHVDEDSLREWFVATNGASVGRYTQTVFAEGSSAANESLLTYYARLKEQDDILNTTAIGSDIILLEIFERTMRAFASDKMFGLDSYLSRRIRHGTLRGHLITPLDRAYRLFEESAVATDDRAEDPYLEEVRDGISRWRTQLLERIDYVRRHVIQIKSEAHPNGLIAATWRIVANVAYLDAMVGRVRGRVMDSNGDYDIFPDVYSSCWDCLESDLSQLRLFMTKDFLSETQTTLRQVWDHLSYDAQAQSRHLFIEMHSILNSRVREVCGWFIRPVFRRDSYSLKTLINTTYSTIKELDDSFGFQECVRMETDIAINRGSFEVFWDVLFVLIGNAARHGKSGGVIRTAAELTEQDEKLVEVSVTSELEEHSSDAHIKRIEDAFSVSIESDLDKAAVEEGFSGLRKLIGLIRRINYPGVNLEVRCDRNINSVTFQAILPAVVLLRWSR